MHVFTAINYGRIDVTLFTLQSECRLRVRKRHKNFIFLHRGQHLKINTADAKTVDKTLFLGL
jgi:hypothetical protein